MTDCHLVKLNLIIPRRIFHSVTSTFRNFIVRDCDHGSLIRGILSQGSSADYGDISSLVLEISLVDGKGEKRTFKSGDPELAAIRACLGMCGVIYEVTLQARIRQDRSLHNFT